MYDVNNSYYREFPHQTKLAKNLNILKSSKFKTEIANENNLVSQNYIYSSHNQLKSGPATVPQSPILHLSPERSLLHSGTSGQRLTTAFKRFAIVLLLCVNMSLFIFLIHCCHVFMLKPLRFVISNY